MFLSLVYTLYMAWLLIPIPISWSDVQAEIEDTLGQSIIATGLAVLIGLGLAGIIVNMVKKAFTR